MDLLFERQFLEWLFPLLCSRRETRQVNCIRCLVKLWPPWGFTRGKTIFCPGDNHFLRNQAIKTIRWGVHQPFRKSLNHCSYFDALYQVNRYIFANWKTWSQRDDSENINSNLVVFTSKSKQKCIYAGGRNYLHFELLAFIQLARPVRLFSKNTLSISPVFAFQVAKFV